LGKIICIEKISWGKIPLFEFSSWRFQSDISKAIS